MNITNYIVEFIKQGNVVEIKGIGTFTPVTIPTYFDEDVKAFFPSIKTVEFSTSYGKGSQQIISYIAKQEFVGITTAEKLWDNYIDALNDKIKNESKHEFSDFGVLTYDPENGYTFKVAEGLNFSKETRHLSSLKRVETYDLEEGREDPFYKFENPTIPEPEEEKPEEIEAEQQSEETQEATETVEEVVETKAFDPEIEQGSIDETTEETAEDVPVAITPETKNIEEVAEESKKWFDVAVENNNTETLKQAETIPVTPASEPKKPSKKKKNIIIPIIILLLLLLLGGTYYYFVVVKDMPIPFIKDKVEETSQTEMPSLLDTIVVATEDTVAVQKEESEAAEETEEVDLFKGANVFTFDYTLVPVENKDVIIPEASNTIIDVITPKIEKFLKRQNYTTAKDLMVERLNEYIVKRLKEILDDNFFHPARLVNYDNYITDYCTDKLQRQRVSRAKSEIISEIQINGLFDEYLNELIDAGLVKRDKIEFVPKQKQKEQGSVPVTEMRLRSKQGFDIIAGFFKNRDNAAREADRFRKRGADAYVINKGNLYYVSLGSAPSQTAAEALLRQLRTWNKENMVIKKW